MSLAAAVIRSLVDTGSVQIGLSLDGREIVDGGYRRQSVPATEWTVRDGQAVTVTEFGPFDGRVRISAADVYVAGERTRTIRFESPVDLAAGMTFFYETTLVARDG